MIISAPLLRSLREFGQWARRDRYRFRVSGPSMEPTLNDGEYVLVDPAAEPKVGDLAVAIHPDQADLLVVKRVAEMPDGGGYVLLGDNPDGTDSRTWGSIDPDRIRGVVTLILDRPMAGLAKQATNRRPPSGWARLLRR